MVERAERHGERLAITTAAALLPPDDEEVVVSFKQALSGDVVSCAMLAVDTGDTADVERCCWDWFIHSVS